MNELVVCEPCRSKYDAGTDSWWPPDCTNCEARFRPRLCEHVCSWILKGDPDEITPRDLA